MPWLYCEPHGKEQEAASRSHAEEYREEGESVLVVKGRLNSGPWRCDRCNAELAPGTPAWLFSALPGRIVEELTDYDFGYEREYFAMTKADTAMVIGADWPDDSIRHRRPHRRSNRQPTSRPLCALDLFKPDAKKQP